jgi:hypothetical protein
MNSDFYDANSPLVSEKLEDKSTYDPENDILYVIHVKI